MMQRPSFLKPLTGAVKEKPLWGFDSETYSKKNKFLMGSIYGDHDICETFWEKEEMLSFIRKKARRHFCKGYLVATNLQFDILSMLEESSLFNKFYPLMRQSQMIYVKVNIQQRHNLKFIDTFNFAPFSVKKWGELLKFPKLKQPSFLGEKNLSHWQKKELEEYNLRDSMITYKAIKLLQKGFNKAGGNLKITIASSSMDLYKRKYLKENYYHPNKRLMDILFKAYFGGRTEAICRGKIKRKKLFDINSLYPYIMRENEFPYPNKYTHSNHIKNKTIQDYEGVAEVSITAPDMHIPLLPYRILKPAPKLLFPVGTFRGYYTFYELRECLKLGYRINKIYHGVIYFKTFRPFKEYVDEQYALRLKLLKESSSMQLIPKLNMNTLYGKFGQKNDDKETIIHGDNVTFEMLHKAERFERVGKFFIFHSKETKIPPFVNPILPVYVTAFARKHLYDLMVKCRDLCYVDTDSLLTSKDFDVDTRLGGLKIVDEVKDGIVVKAKMYLINDKAKCKGIRINTRADFMELMKKKYFKLTKFVKFREANRRGLKYNEIIEINKVLDFEDNKRLWPAKFDYEDFQESDAVSI